jgi:hypothetical protein
MALMDWFSRQTPLQLALKRGTRPGGNLADELRRLGDYPVKSQADAEAIADALFRIARDGLSGDGESQLHALVGLFQQVEGPGCPAFSVLTESGIASLVWIVDTALRDSTRFPADDVLFALKILAMYGTREGTEAVIRAARGPLKPDAYLWSVILQVYSRGHPGCGRVLAALADPLPPGFLAVALLDCANAALIGGESCAHPFDSAAGKQQLRSWLTDPDPDHVSYAVSAAVALPFISNPERDLLLTAAFGHPAADVKMEAAWAAAKLGREAGVRCLARYCLDVSCSDKAKRYLAELGREEAIPAEAADADFAAKAEFAQWLAHPNELGHTPDELEIVDRRVLPWPPEREPKTMWLIEYRVRDTTGLKDDRVGAGVVGSVTFCHFFLYGLEQRPPEDAYAIHCYWEMERRGLLAETGVEGGSTEYDPMLRQGAIDGLAGARILRVVEMAPQLNYPQRLVAVAKAAVRGEAGWAVLDGARSRWYPASEMPETNSDKPVVMVHVGRELLGFREQPDRRKYLRPPAAKRPARQVIAAYERLLDEARAGSAGARKLLGKHSPLASALEEYASALAAERERPLAGCVADAYEALQSAARGADPSLHGELFDNFSPLGEHFETYVDALIRLGRQPEVPALIEQFRPYWQHNLGYGQLGTAAFKSGHDRIAEPLLDKLRHSYPGWCRAQEMSFLAEIWHRQGRTEDSHALLLDVMRGVAEQSRTAAGSDRELFEERFQFHRASYLRLFPDRGDAALRRQGIATSTLAERQ